MCNTFLLDLEVVRIRVNSTLLDVLELPFNVLCICSTFLEFKHSKKLQGKMSKETMVLKNVYFVSISFPIHKKKNKQRFNLKNFICRHENPNEIYKKFSSCFYDVM